jgi:hypothetical protein
MRKVKKKKKFDSEQRAIILLSSFGRFDLFDRDIIFFEVEPEFLNSFWKIVYISKSSL